MPPPGFEPGSQPFFNSSGFDSFSKRMDERAEYLATIRQGHNQIRKNLLLNLAFNNKISKPTCCRKLTLSAVSRCLIQVLLELVK